MMTIMIEFQVFILGAHSNNLLHLPFSNYKTCVILNFYIPMLSLVFYLIGVQDSDEPSPELVNSIPGMDIA